MATFTQNSIQLRWLSMLSICMTALSVPLSRYPENIPRKSRLVVMDIALVGPHRQDYISPMCCPPNSRRCTCRDIFQSRSLVSRKRLGGGSF
ncbi:hypothetical protein B0T13DRAFT_455953 [Neurospora crassa]|nr:hypothetical protein B0T13DRAFT_455953 [Neurospora crassa]